MKKLLLVAVALAFVLAVNPSAWNEVQPFGGGHGYSGS